MTKEQKEALREEYESRFNRCKIYMDAQEVARANDDEEIAENFYRLWQRILEQVTMMDKVLAIMGYSRECGENDTIEFIKVK